MGRGGKKGDGKRRGKGDGGSSTERPAPKKKAKGENGAPSQAPNARGDSKGRKQKSEIPCKFYKKGNCTHDPCEFKH